MASRTSKAKDQPRDQKQTLMFEFRRLLTRAHSVNKRMVRRTEAERLADRQKKKLRDRLAISSKERKGEIRDHEE